MKRYKCLIAILLAAIAMLALTGCGKEWPSLTQNGSEAAVLQAEPTAALADTEATANMEKTWAKAAEGPEEEPWKIDLAENLFEVYGVLPEYYEDMGDGLYRVYVEVGGEIVPFVVVSPNTVESPRMRQ